MNSSERKYTPGDVQNAWFSLPNKNEEDDDLVRERLEDPFERAREGTFEDWAETDRGRLALILLFDQVPRHLFRNQPEQYAYDERARELSSRFYEDGFPDDFEPIEQFYAALPYLHAEDVEKQEKANPVISELADEIDELHFMADVADDYLDQIRRFGRFPHRNEILGRETTPEEEEFLN